MPKLIDCVRGCLSEGDWYLWFDELDRVWNTGQFATHEGDPVMMLADGAMIDIEWVAYKGYRIVHK